MQTTTFLMIGILAIACVLLVLIYFRVRNIANLADKETDLLPVLSGIERVRTSQEQTDRLAREEFSRSRQEQSIQAQGLRNEVTRSLTGIEHSVSGKVESLTTSNEQKLERLREGVERRLESLTTESGRQSEALSDSVRVFSASLREEVSTKLADFRSLLDATIRETYGLQIQQTEAIAKAILTFQSAVDEKQSRLQTAIENKLATLAQQNGESLSKMETSFRTEAQQLREETWKLFKNLGDGMTLTLTGVSQTQRNELQEIRNTVNNRLEAIQVDNEKKLEQMRQTVDEKLQGTLEARLGESFRQVSEHLEQVFQGLGEMRTLATGVGDLKRILTNVKVRGTWGESQLGAIIEDILAPDQFGKNIATTGTTERVEYAVKLPGRDRNGEAVWLPIDAKFPLEDYDRLIQASERGDAAAVDRASKHLEATLRSCARNVSDRYLAPPLTTDFGILFLSTEGLYAEAMRRPGLADSIQRESRIILAGPSTLAALLNALQMGFRTLAIEKRSSEVWEILGAVKTEFSKYAGVLAKVKKKLNEAQNTIGEAETRARVIQRKLVSVENSETPELVEVTAEEEEESHETAVMAGGVKEEVYAG